MDGILDQLKQRRKKLGLKQNDMMLRVGMSRQQYQRLESKGNPRLYTLELLAKGLNSKLMLIPRDQLAAVRALLSDVEPHSKPKPTLADDPWQDILEADDE